MSSVITPASRLGALSAEVTASIDAVVAGDPTLAVGLQRSLRGASTRTGSISGAIGMSSWDSFGGSAGADILRRASEEAEPFRLALRSAVDAVNAVDGGAPLGSVLRAHADELDAVLGPIADQAGLVRTGQSHTTGTVFAQLGAGDPKAGVDRARTAIQDAGLRAQQLAEALSSARRTA